MESTVLPGGGDHLENEKPETPLIEADISTSFTYASYQNSIPVVSAIRVLNPTADWITQARLTLSAAPAFLRAKTWTIDRLAPGDEISVSDRKVELDADYLAGLDEAERGDVTLRLSTDNKVLAEERFPVRLLARDEWGGVGDMAQLLPAFVMPNDAAVAKILRAAADRLAAHGHRSAIDGYQNGDPRRAWMLAAAIYSAVAGLSIHYAEPPASFERRGQKIRRPGTINAQGLATCLDTSLLFAAALEAAGLHPVVLLFDDHATAGLWLVKRTLPRAVEEDVVELRKAISARELLVFETTGVTQRPPMIFEHACASADARLSEAQEASFVAAVDIARSRSSGITPLASHAKAPAEEGTEDEPVTELPLPPMPELASGPDETAEEKPTTPTERIERWRRKLLDLSLRNRLLNFTGSKATVPFLCPDAAYLEDRLAHGVRIRIVSLPEQNPLGGRDAELYREARGQDLHRQFAADALQRDELASTLDARAMDARLTALYRQAKNDLAEGGTNTLYLAVGFLRWKKKPQDERSYRAPLLLVPVKLDRRSATSEFCLLLHEDEVRFNATLLQFLERDFALRIPSLECSLPADDDGIDVPAILERMRQAVRDVPGFEVVDETALATFSFAKFLMWKDLTDRIDALRQNRVVKHLIDTPDQPFVGGAVFRNERDIDRAYSPADIVTPLPADSSQLVASLAAAEGKDFVIVGPPGTGKSQTIANMIANCLASGKTVLFVAEKTAALNVVYRRLREHGLEDHCLELHSNKADRRRFLGQLRSSWENGRRDRGSQWVELNDRLKLRRDELNAYVDALHREHGNGLTPFQAMGIASRGRDRHAPELCWPAKDAHDRDGLRYLEELASELGLTFSAVRFHPVLNLIDIRDWTSLWQERLLAAARAYREATRELGRSLSAFRRELGLAPSENTDRGALERYVAFAGNIRESGGEDYAVIFEQEFDRIRSSLGALEEVLAAYADQESALSARYDRGEIDRIPVDDLDRDWREAKAALWPMSWVRIRKCRKFLQSYASSGKADPENDLPRVRKMQSAAAEATRSPLAVVGTHFAGVDTDTSRLRNHLDSATRLRSALFQLVSVVGEVEAVARAVAPTICGAGNEALPGAADAFSLAHERFLAAGQQFHEIAGFPSDGHPAQDLSQIAVRMGEVEECRHLLRDWSSWCAVRTRAIAAGLGQLVSDIEAGAIPPAEARDAFRLGYVRWWLPLTIDDDAVLRSFRRFQHENAITEFCEIDDLVRKAASERVMSAIAHDLPSPHEVPRRSELGLLRHQMELQRPSRSIREMIGSMPESFPKLAPCMLMSPLSIAQYLPPDQSLFDVVIFDEASQITTWDAVGAVARGRQTIIVGDPKQLPPTNFFGRNDDDGDVQYFDRDLESILDEAKASGLPVHDLRWHYRSRHESLIAFSNSNYYENRLITFPSPVTEDRAVSFRHVPNAVYDRGKSRTNKEEARAIAREVAGRLKRWLSLPERERPTIGVITFNSQQQALIQDLLDHERRASEEIEWFFEDERTEPVFVKNLENVQGDERDVILFSITFCHDLAAKLTMNFGALNNDGGERRLNVAVTRARQELVVFSGIRAEDIDTARTRAVGVHHLKAFLDYAQRGAVALPAVDAGSQGEAESPFELAVIQELLGRGWHVVPQVGVSGFRVDIGVKHPDRAGAYLAGVECDGATYHRSATARDRDKVREQVLRGLGWNILRVWSTDWWFDSTDTARRLHDALKALLEESRQARSAEEAEPHHWEMGDTEEGKVTLPDSDEEDAAGFVSVPDELEDESLGNEEDDILLDNGGSLPDSGSVSGDAVALGGPVYHMADLSSFRADPEAFYEFSYRDTLQAMVDAVLEAEAPVREDILMQRVARAHGWLRTGNRIRQRIQLHLRDVDRTEESSGCFLWKKGTAADRITYRVPYDPQHRRAISEICLAELCDIAMSEKGLLVEEDPALVLARLLGVDRLSASSRTRLEAVLGDLRRVDQTVR